MIEPAPHRIELRHLRSYVAVAEERHFRRAAERLHMSQPPLSQQIKTLEEALGVELLIRNRRGVEVTVAGQAFLEQARAVLAAMDQAVDVARRADRGELGRLSIGFVGSAMYGRVPDVLRRFRTEHLGVHLTLRELGTAAQVDGLVHGEIDVGFLRPPVSAEGIEIEHFADEPVVVVLPQDHHLVGMPSLTLVHLRRERFVQLSAAAAPGQHDAIQRALAAEGAAPLVVQEAEGLQTVVGLVASGLGVSLVPASVRALDRHDVVYRDIVGPAPRVELAVAFRKRDTSPVVASFVEAVRAARDGRL
ncbi:MULTISPECIES: LysR substrate-binding domain-containing protein [Solirubrobacterales]|uniref:LysR substrate-binding domain-containing protein n=1 Tax=Solirubrobacterales TaxID=588673 RepID=UPI0013048511|nr:MULTISPECIES: LysR substrate-binding domain-containing protein [Solirubrobacterales]